MQLEWLIFGLGAFFLALNQVVKDSDGIRAKWPDFAMPGWFSYVPLALCIVAFGVWLIKPTAVSTLATDQATELPIGPNLDVIPKAVPTASPAPSDEKAKDSEEILSVSGLDLKQISRELEGLTTIEKENRSQKYKGIPIVILGKISDVREGFVDPEKYFHISINGKLDSFGFTANVNRASFSFENQQAGTLISMKCVVDEVYSFGTISLDKCSSVEFPKPR